MIPPCNRPQASHSSRNDQSPIPIHGAFVCNPPSTGVNPPMNHSIWSLALINPLSNRQAGIHVSDHSLYSAFRDPFLSQISVAIAQRARAAWTASVVQSSRHRRETLARQLAIRSYSSPHSITPTPPSAALVQANYAPHLRRLTSSVHTTHRCV